MASITYTTPSTDPTAPPTIRHATVPLDRIRSRPPAARTPDPQPTYLNLSDPDLNPQPIHPNPGDQTTRPPPTVHPGTPSRGIRKVLLDRWKRPHERSKPQPPTIDTPALNSQSIHSDPNGHTTQPPPSAASPDTPFHSKNSLRNMRKKLMWECRWKQDEAAAPLTPNHTPTAPTPCQPTTGTAPEMRTQPVQTEPLATPCHPPTHIDQTTADTQLPTYVTASPISIPIAHQVHIPTAHVILDPDPRVVVRAAMRVLRRPIPPDTMRYIDSINRRTDAQLVQDADTRRKRGRQMMQAPFDMDPTSLSMMARYGRPTQRQRRTERWIPHIHGTYTAHFEDTSPTPDRHTPQQTSQQPHSTSVT